MKSRINEIPEINCIGDNTATIPAARDSILKYVVQIK